MNMEAGGLRIMDILFEMFGACPLFLVWAVGIILAIVRWRQNPRAGLYTVLALAGFFLWSIVALLVYTFAVPRLSNGMSLESFRIVLVGLRFFCSLLEAILFGLLLLAIFFTSRQILANEPRYEPSGQRGSSKSGGTGIQEPRPRQS